MVADFSHLRKLRPAWIGQFHERGEAVADEELADALEQIEPPLLSRSETMAMMRILRPRRGRPPQAAPSREQLISRLRALCRPDMSGVFVSALIYRLRQKRGLTYPQLFGRDLRKLKRQQRDSMIRHLYHEMKGLQTGEAVVSHKILGEIEVPAEPSARSERALEMTHGVMRERMAIKVPSNDRMMNIISEQEKFPADSVSFQRPKLR
jgi:hypothetical protein